MKKKIIYILLLILLNIFNGYTQTQEYVLKAVYLERFARFMEWPNESSVKNLNTPFIIGVIGENPFGGELEKLYKIQLIKQKKVDIKYISDYNEITSCAFLFISKSETKNIPLILDIIKNKPIVTISDIPDARKKGIHISFITQNNKILFELNESAFNKSNIIVDYRLKQYAVNSVKK